MQIVRWPLRHGGGSQVPKLIVLHAMAEFNRGTGPVDLYAVDLLNVLGFSVHAFVTPSGVVIRSRAEHESAYHAKGHNLGSLGVEFLVPGLHDYASFLEAMKAPYLTDVQYAAGVELVRSWKEAHSIERIATHAELDPARKMDPGSGFPLERFLEDVA